MQITLSSENFTHYFGHFSAAPYFPDRLAIMRGCTPFTIFKIRLCNGIAGPDQEFLFFLGGGGVPTLLKSKKQNKPQKGAVLGFSKYFLYRSFVRPVQ